MDESSLPDIARLLSGSLGPSTRAATCTAIAGCTAGTAGSSLRKTIGTTTHGETILRRLLTLCGDPNCSRVALSALVNLSEEESASAIIIHAGGVERCTKALMSPDQRPLSALYSGLLSNLTRFSQGVNALVGNNVGAAAGRVAVDRLFQLVASLDTIPNVLWLSNVCSTTEGRATLLLKNDETDVNKQPLTWLLRLLPDGKDETRLAAASALRNCAMAEDCHHVLLERTNALGVCLSRFVTVKQVIRLESIADAPSEVKEAVRGQTKTKPELHVEIRLILVEALLLMCKTLIGRKTLREKDTYPVLEAWLKEEQNDQVKRTVDNILDRIAAAEEGDEINTDIASNGISGMQQAVNVDSTLE